MAENNYATVAGFVQQFGDTPAVATRDANGQQVRDFTVKALGTQKLVKITLWPEYAGLEVGKGYFVAADGKFSVSESNGRQFYNLSATVAIALPPALKADREVVNAQGAASVPAAADDEAPF